MSLEDFPLESQLLFGHLSYLELLFKKYSPLVLFSNKISRFPRSCRDVSSPELRIDMKACVVYFCQMPCAGVLCGMLCLICSPPEQIYAPACTDGVNSPLLHLVSSTEL